MPKDSTEDASSLDISKAKYDAPGSVIGFACAADGEELCGFYQEDAYLLDILYGVSRFDPSAATPRVILSMRDAESAFSDIAARFGTSCLLMHHADGEWVPKDIWVRGDGYA